NTRAEAQTPPLWNSVVIHGKNGKTHILMYALSGEDKLIPSPRVQLEMQWLHDRHGMAARPASTPAAADKPSIVMP
ncbi:MAG TPA: hypothetical protein VKT32_16840, partial [Chthonomonadaceae bacterium]|nr:hypothetical protein [Chthonomonadaceae bacterium]